MGRTLRTIGILASGAAVVAAAWLDAPAPLGPLSPMGWLRAGLPVYLYVFAQCWLSEGRARERRARGFRGDDQPGSPPGHPPASSPAHEPTDDVRPR
ncbi:uncharacterized protein SOCE836_097310 [Sorangium cellulosum]|uniref:Uncharacterized protein n=1 Tax=Sorangium cellulosum TaxID=56 RepID=A0A4P2R434_SORCE|nr:uncharacterized protein SOCE836_097310 [Sorangium cellulosum]WCQ96797.1 hypothetical protein NQZ70_09584 [Sorangium sp. Soce836]